MNDFNDANKGTVQMKGEINLICNEKVIKSVEGLAGEYINEPVM